MENNKKESLALGYLLLTGITVVSLFGIFQIVQTIVIVVSWGISLI
jgi:hypothetical protein